MDELEEGMGGAESETRVNAEANIRAMFNSAFGDEYTVDFDYRK